MSCFKIENNDMTLIADTEKSVYRVETENGGVKQQWEITEKPYILFKNGKKAEFGIPIKSDLFENGTQKGVFAVYGNFKNSKTEVTAKAYIEKTSNTVFFEVYITNDEFDELSAVSYPAPFDFGAKVGEGYTVLPRMQGTLFPAGEEIVTYGGKVYERDSIMPMYGQKRNESAYIAIYDTPFDVRFEVHGDKIVPLWKTSLGHFSYPRRIRFNFLAHGDYNDMAKVYRSYVKSKGQLVTLKEKEIKNPEIKRLEGCPIIHTSIATHISSDSDFYNKENPEKNDTVTSFSVRAEQISELKKKGLKKGYTHFDGWGFHGYDNLHPSPLPPNREAGGVDGMIKLSETVRKQGYIFGIHDQYRDYYFDCSDFSIDEAVNNSNGECPEPDIIWYGGKHTFLCPARAPEYVARNYAELERLGVKIEAAYLDVFSIVEMDECFNPSHPVTREQCAEYRKRCLDLLNSKGIITSSEETVDCIIPSMALCHHSPFFTRQLPNTKSEAVGIPIPLFNLVYHDCLIVPWIGLKNNKGGWGIPGNDCGFTHAILNSGPVYCPIDATSDIIEQVEEACTISERLTHCEMIKHEFISSNMRQQRAIYSDGTIIEVDFDTDEYKIFLRR